MKQKIIIALILSLILTNITLANAGVFNSIPEKVRAGFSDDSTVEIRKYKFTGEEQKEIKEYLGVKKRISGIVYYEGVSGEETLGYAVFVKERGKHGDIVLLVFISPELTLSNILIIRNPERYGHKIKRKGFLNQFKGIGPKTDYDNVDTITGATISSKAVIRGVKKAVLLISLAIPNV